LVKKKTRKESSGSDNAKIAGENNVEYFFFFFAKDIYLELVPEKQIVNGKFYKEVIKRLIARIHRFGSVFQDIESWYLLHDNAPANSSGVVSEFSAK
jgi:hypothetical protein